MVSAILIATTLLPQTPTQAFALDWKKHKFDNCTISMPASTLNLISDDKGPGWQVKSWGGSFRIGNSESLSYPCTITTWSFDESAWKEQKSWSANTFLYNFAKNDANVSQMVPLTELLGPKESAESVNTMMFSTEMLTSKQRIYDSAKKISSPLKNPNQTWGRDNFGMQMGKAKLPASGGISGTAGGPAGTFSSGGQIDIVWAFFIDRDRRKLWRCTIAHPKEKLAIIELAVLMSSTSEKS